MKIQSLVIFLSFTICLFYHYSKMPPTHILTLTLPVEFWVEGLAKGLLNQPHPDSENINVYLLLNMIISFIINLHIEGDMYEYLCTELSACIFGKDVC